MKQTEPLRETGRKKLALLVMSEDRHQSLLKCLEACDIEVLPVCDCRQARQMLEANSGVEVVLTDVTLADGTWADLATEAARRQRRAEVIICMRVADPELWVDVLQGGAYDVLVEPYHGDEVKRIVQAAVARSGPHLRQVAAA